MTMSGMTSERLEELRRIAEAATPGPWGMNPENGLVDEAATLTPVCGMVWVRTEEQTLANATHIASFDPSTVLVLLDEIERLRRERAVLAEAVMGWQRYLERDVGTETVHVRTLEAHGR